MGKTATYLIMLAMIILGYHFFGLIQNTPISFLIDALLNPETLDRFAFTNSILFSLGTVTVVTGAIIAGTLFPNRFQWIVVTGFATLLITVGWDAIAIFNQVRQVNVMLAVFVISPMLLLYLMSVMEWWRGIDN